MAIRFVDGGLAEMIPRFQDPNADNINDGCDINDLSDVVPQITSALTEILAAIGKVTP